MDAAVPAPPATRAPTRMRRFGIAATISVLLAVVVPFLTDASFLDGVLSILAVMISMGVLVVGTFCWLVGRVAKSDKLTGRGLSMLAIAVVGLLQWLTIPVRDSITEGQRREATAYAESLVPLVEQHRARTGACPATQQELGAKGAPPAFLQGQTLYRGQGGTPASAAQPCDYQLGFRLPSHAPMVSVQYDREKKAWSVED